MSEKVWINELREEIRSIESDLDSLHEISNAMRSLGMNSDKLTSITFRIKESLDSIDEISYRAFDGYCKESQKATASMIGAALSAFTICKTCKGRGTKEGTIMKCGCAHHDKGSWCEEPCKDCGTTGIR